MSPTTSPIRFRLAAILVACMAAVAPAAAHAQVPVEPGARVRVLAPSAADTLLTGRLMAMDSATLLLAPRLSERSIPVPLASVQRLEVSRGGERRTWEYAAIGALVLGVAGWLGGGAAQEDDCEYVCILPHAFATLGVLTGGIGGAIVGYRSTGPERWVEVPIGRGP